MLNWQSVSDGEMKMSIGFRVSGTVAGIEGLIRRASTIGKTMGYGIDVGEGGMSDFSGGGGLSQSGFGTDRRVGTGKHGGGR